MKRILAIVLLVALIASLALLTGCAEERECDFCGEMAECEKITYQGEAGYFCPDCAELVESMLDLVG